MNGFQPAEPQSHCRYYLRGECYRGENCMYIHDPSKQKAFREGSFDPYGDLAGYTMYTGTRDTVLVFPQNSQSNGVGNDTADVPGTSFGQGNIGKSSVNPNRGGFSKTWQRGQGASSAAGNDMGTMSIGGKLNNGVASSVGSDWLGRGEGALGKTRVTGQDGRIVSMTNNQQTGPHNNDYGYSHKQTSPVTPNLNIPAHQPQHQRHGTSSNTANSSPWSVSQRPIPPPRPPNTGHPYGMGGQMMQGGFGRGGGDGGSRSVVMGDRRPNDFGPGSDLRPRMDWGPRGPRGPQGPRAPGHPMGQDMWYGSHQRQQQFSQYPPTQQHNKSFQQPPQRPPLRHVVANDMPRSTGQRMVGDQGISRGQPYRAQGSLGGGKQQARPQDEGGPKGWVTGSMGGPMKRSSKDGAGSSNKGALGKRESEGTQGGGEPKKRAVLVSKVVAPGGAVGGGRQEAPGRTAAATKPSTKEQPGTGSSKQLPKPHQKQSKGAASQPNGHITTPSTAKKPQPSLTTEKRIVQKVQAGPGRGGRRHWGEDLSRGTKDLDLDDDNAMDDLLQGEFEAA